MLSGATQTRVDLILSSLVIACAAFAIRWTLHGLKFEFNDRPELARGCYSHAFAIIVVGSLALLSRSLLIMIAGRLTSF